MKPTGNKLLDVYIKKLYQLTFNLEAYFAKTYSYKKRLKTYKKKWIPVLKEIKRTLLFDLKHNVDFRQALAVYMEQDLDVIFWFNGFLKGVDQRKFGSKAKEIPFVVYPYQVVIAELSKRTTTLTKKSRDMGLSVLFSGLDAGQLAFVDAFESFFLSEKRDKVDVVGDYSQTLMGKIRAFLRDSGIVDISKYYADKHLHLWRSVFAKIDGSAMKDSAANGYRYDFIRLDEVGLVKNVGRLIDEMTLAGGHIAMFGTLKMGSDADFRERLLITHIVDHKAIWKRFRVLEAESKLTYTEIWDLIYKEITKDLEEDAPLRIDITYRDHPFKFGNCDYLALESAKLFHNPTAIALQLEASLEAGSVDRALQQLDPNIHFQYDSKFAKVISDPANWKSFKLVGGFDPGGHRGTAFVPVIMDTYGFSYVLPVERFESGDMLQWLIKMRKKYSVPAKQKVEIYADQAITQYEKEGALWSAVIRKKEVQGAFKFTPVSNRDSDDMLILVNSVLCVTKMHPVTKETLPLITFAEENRGWSMGYMSRGKYTNDVLQKRWSHPSDAFLYWAFNTYKYLLDFDGYYFNR